MQSPTLPFLFIRLPNFCSFVNDHRVEKRSIETTSWFASRPEFRFKTFFFFWVLYPKIYVHICNRCIRSAIFVCPISGDPGNIVLVPKCKNCERRSSYHSLIFDLTLFSDSLLDFIYLFVSNGVRHPVCIYELVYTYKFP